MKQENDESTEILVDHFFRNEYGKIVSVISKYVEIVTAEDIVQETLLTAAEYWQHNGIPPNPSAWLYTTSKNKALNFIRKHKFEKNYQGQIREQELVTIDFSDEQISDEQLRVMAACCHPSISEETQIALILKILCGFSITEISSAFYASNETINKRLVRGRDKLKKNGFYKETSIDINSKLEVLLTTIYLLFNEGYFPSKKNQVVRKDFCVEAIRLAEIIVSNEKIIQKENAHALLALMSFNCSRFEARVKNVDEIIEMELQDRTLWNQELVNKGLYHLKEAQKNKFVSKYLILACISANHSISQTYEQTNWKEILSLYDVLLNLENSVIVKLNRLVALSKVKGSNIALTELRKLKGLTSNYLYHATLAELYRDTKDYAEAKIHYEKAISLATNVRDKNFLVKKLNGVVPISKSHV